MKNGQPHFLSPDMRYIPMEWDGLFWAHTGMAMETRIAIP